jgi:hypothetical protein
MICHDNHCVVCHTGATKEAGKTIAAWQALGHDLGTTVAKTPSDAQIITMARGVLLMPPSPRPVI